MTTAANPQKIHAVFKGLTYGLIIQRRVDTTNKRYLLSLLRSEVVHLFPYGMSLSRWRQFLWSWGRREH
jgi:hypothetical protein